MVLDSCIRFKKRISDKKTRSLQLKTTSIFCQMEERLNGVFLRKEKNTSAKFVF